MAEASTPGMSSLSTVTMTIASPCVVTKTAHGLSTDDPVMFTTTGALPTGVSPNTIYYASVINLSTFNLKAKPSGSNINTSGSQSGTHTGYGGVGTSPAATLSAGTYFPMVYVKGSTGYLNYLFSSFSRFHFWGSFRRQVYTPPLGFTPFAQI